MAQGANNTNSESSISAAWPIDAGRPETWLALHSVLAHPAVSTTLAGMSTVVGVEANGGGMGAWHDAALFTGVLLTPNWRIDVDPVETL